MGEDGIPRRKNEGDNRIIDLVEVVLLKDGAMVVGGRKISIGVVNLKIPIHTINILKLSGL